MGDTPTTFECQRCGGCCGLVPMPKVMFRRFKRHMVRTGPIRRVMVRRWSPFVQEAYVMDTEDGHCPFLNNDTNPCVCMIYDHRPVTCQLQGMVPELPCPRDPAQAELVEQSRIRINKLLAKNGDS